MCVRLLAYQIPNSSSSHELRDDTSWTCTHYNFVFVNQIYLLITSLWPRYILCIGSFTNYQCFGRSNDCGGPADSSRWCKTNNSALLVCLAGKKTEHQTSFSDGNEFIHDDDRAKIYLQTHRRVSMSQWNATKCNLCPPKCHTLF